MIYVFLFFDIFLLLSYSNYNGFSLFLFFPDTQFYLTSNQSARERERVERFYYYFLFNIYLVVKWQNTQEVALPNYIQDPFEPFSNTKSM